MNRKYYISFAVLLGTLGLNSCVDPFEAEDLGYERLLVVEGIITDSMQRQQIVLSNTTPLDSVLYMPERGATVQVKASDGRTYTFSELTPGTYQSTEVFAAETGIGYQLEITTLEGEQLSSEENRFSSNPGIEAVYAGMERDANGNEEMVIYVDAIGSSEDVTYYRYEYEETYMLIAPRWAPFDFVVINDEFPDFEVGLVTRTQEERVCFNTDKSTAIIQEATQGLQENRLLQFPIRRLSKDDYRIAHRYSLLVKQFTQSADAYAFYEHLNDISSVTNLFSTIQPGRLEGNVRSDSRGGRDAIGYFEVASVSSTRFFVNYDDVFNESPINTYPINCEPLGSPPLFYPGSHPMGITTSPLIDAIQAGVIKYVADNSNPGDGQGPYFTTTTPCGDCNAFGTNVKPDYWVD